MLAVRVVGLCDAVEEGERARRARGNVPMPGAVHGHAGFKINDVDRAWMWVGEMERTQVLGTARHTRRGLQWDIGQLYRWDCLGYWWAHTSPTAPPARREEWQARDHALCIGYLHHRGSAVLLSNG